jgi:cytochrome P450
MTVAERLPAMPFDRSSVLELPAMYRVLQGQRPISRVTTPAGDVAWLVTGYEVVKELFTDTRLGRAHPDPARAPRFSKSFMFLGGSIGNYETEMADHARMRRVLTRSFMVKRMNEMRPAIQGIVDETLERMTAMTPPVDFYDAFSFVVPILAICQLLGVPRDDRDRFRAWTSQSMHMWDPETAAAGHGQLRAYMAALIERKRGASDEDVISDLILAQREEDRFDESDMIDLCVALLMAGHDTTAARIDLGLLFLLTHPDQLDALRADADLVTGAVEEILRLAVPGLGVIMRYATADVEVAGETVRAGDLVLVSTDAANRDRSAFPDPDRFDIRRKPNQHVAFGHSLRFCLGAGLARVELQTVFSTLFQRVPGLRLAVPVEELRLNDERSLGGLRELPVTW